MTRLQNQAGSLITTPEEFSIDTLTLIQHYIDPNPKRSGSENVFVRCPNPDHDDSSRDNCSVSLTKNIFNCFACGAKGHISHALRWRNAPEYIIDRVASTRSRPLAYEGPEPVKYLDDDLLFAYEHTPKAWIDDGFSPELLNQHQIGYDHYHDRITVPIRDLSGKLVAISGRNLSGHGGKYKVYKSELGEFQPHRYSPKVHDHLWRAHLLEPDCIRQIVVVEGYKAALWLVQCGILSTVAIMGSKISDAQVSLLSSLTDEVWMMLDADEAGRRGQRLSAIKLYRSGINVKCVHYAKDVKQPDDMAMQDVHESFLQLNDWRHFS